MRDAGRDSPEDDEIQRLIKNGRFTEAFEKAYLDFKQAVKYRIIAALRGNVDDPEAEAEDLTQKIFTELFRKLPTHYDPNISKVSTYLYMITTRRIQSRLRQIKYNISYDLASGKNEDEEDHSPNPETLFLDQEKVEIVKRAIVNLLTPFDGQIVMSFLFGGLSVTDIARAANRSPKNIYTRLAKACAVLQKEFEGDE